MLKLNDTIVCDGDTFRLVADEANHGCDDCEARYPCTMWWGFPPYRCECDVPAHFVLERKVTT